MENNFSRAEKDSVLCNRETTSSIDIINKSQTSYLGLDLIKSKDRESHMTEPLKSFIVQVFVAVTFLKTLLSS